ncbi:MAG: RHS repeat domain-containing protein [Acidobacteriota bacterium]
MGGYSRYNYENSNWGLGLLKLTQKLVNAYSGQGEIATSYAYTQPTGPGQWSTRLTEPDGSYAISKFSTGDYDDASGRQLSKEHYNASGTMLDQETQAWITDASGVNRRTRVTNGLGTGWTYVDYNYDAVGNVTSEIHQAGLSHPSYQMPFRQRQINRTYQALTTYRPGYFEHTIYRLQEESVTDSAWAAGTTLVSKTHYDYDQFAVTQRGSVVGYDANLTSFGTVRGNPTTISRWLASESRWVASKNYYDSLGNVVQTTDPRNYSTTINYSSTFHYAYPTQVVNAKGQSASANYNFYTGQPASATNENNFTTTTSYDGLNRPSRIDGADGSYTRLTYDLTLNNFATTIYKSVASGQEASTTSFLDGIGRERKRKTTDPAGDIYVDTIYALCDCTGKTSKVSSPYHTGETVYWTETQYDALGRPSKIIPPDGTSSSNHARYSYDLTTPTTIVTDPAGKTRRYEYDALGRIWRVTEPNSSGQLAQQASYNYLPVAGENRIVITQGSQARTFAYDTLGRLLWEAHPENGTTSYVYDDNGNVTRKTDARGWATVTTYDELNRPTAKTYQNDGGVTPQATLTYDSGLQGIGKPATWLAGSSSGSYRYDGMGRIYDETRTINGVTATVGYGYNLAGQNTSANLSNGWSYTSGYDSVGNLETISSNFAGGIVTNIDRNAAGQLTWIQYANAIVNTRSYNNTLQLASLAVSLGGTNYFSQGYSYTTSEAVYPVPIPNQGFEEGMGGWELLGGRVTVRSDYVLTGQYSAKVDGPLAIVRTSSFIPVSGNKSYKLTASVYIPTATSGNIYLDLDDGNGQGQSFQDISVMADPGIAGQWQTLTGTFTTAAATTGVKIRIIRDSGPIASFYVDEVSIGAIETGSFNNGRLQQITDNLDASKSISYTYDELNRLKTAATTGVHWGLSWTYDRWGNRQNQTVTKGTAPSNSLAIDSSSNRVTGWTYDAAGNVTNDGRNTYSYDAENRVISVNGGATTYAYDASGGRVQKTSGGTVVRYFFGLAENTNGAWTKFLVATPAGVAEWDGATLLYKSNDHLGTARVVTNTSGVVVGRVDMYPYGEVWSETGTTTKYKFTDKERDTESGNDYFGARYYWSGAGRWLGVDPVLGNVFNPQRLNRYAYCINDPINYTDPDGAEPNPKQVWEEFLEWVAEREAAQRRKSGSHPKKRDEGRLWRRSFEQKVNRSLNQLENKLAPGNISADCQNLFNALGISVSDFLNTLGGLQFSDGTTTTSLATQLSSDPQYQSWINAWLAKHNLPGSSTVQDIFKAKPGLSGWAPPPTQGSDVFLRGGRAANPATLGHETFHKFGFVDEDIQTTWGIKVDPNNTHNISDHFKKNCL